MDGLIRTERLLLRPLRAGDAEPVFALFANWEVVRWLCSPPWPYSLEDARSFIRSRDNQGLTDTSFAITLADAPIGVIDVRMKNAAIEVAQAGKFDFVIINELFDRALFDLKAIVHSQRLKFAAQRRARAETFKALLIP